MLKIEDPTNSVAPGTAVHNSTSAFQGRCFLALKDKAAGEKVAFIFIFSLVFCY